MSAPCPSGALWRTKHPECRTPSCPPIRDVLWASVAQVGGLREEAGVSAPWLGCMLAVGTAPRFRSGRGGRRFGRCRQTRGSPLAGAGGTCASAGGRDAVYAAAIPSRVESSWAASAKKTKKQGSAPLSSQTHDALRRPGGASRGEAARIGHAAMGSDGAGPMALHPSSASGAVMPVDATWLVGHVASRWGVARTMPLPWHLGVARRPRLAQIAAAFETLFYDEAVGLAPGGVYIVLDVQGAYREGGSRLAFFKGLADDMPLGAARIGPGATWERAQVHPHRRSIAPEFTQNRPRIHARAAWSAPKRPRIDPESTPIDPESTWIGSRSRSPHRHQQSAVSSGRARRRRPEVGGKSWAASRWRPVLGGQ